MWAFPERGVSLRVTELVFIEGPVSASRPLKREFAESFDVETSGLRRKYRPSFGDMSWDSDELQSAENLLPTVAACPVGVLSHGMRKCDFHPVQIYSRGTAFNNLLAGLCQRVVSTIRRVNPIVPMAHHFRRRRNASSMELEHLQ